MERARQRKINAGALAPKTVNRNTDDLQDLQSKGIFDSERLYQFDVPAPHPLKPSKTRTTASNLFVSPPRIPHSDTERAKGLSAAQRGKEIRLQGSVRKAGGPKLTSLKLPMLQDIMLEQGHKFSTSLVHHLDSVQAPKRGLGMQGADAKGERRAGTEIPADPSKLVREYGDSDLNEMIKTVNLQTSQEAITFFARHGASTPLKFVHCIEPSTSGKQYDPYNLQVVAQKECKGSHYTISAAGVVKVKLGEPSEFISMPDWMRQVNVFRSLRSIRFFKNYLIIKAIRSWRRRMHLNAYTQRRQNLIDELFLARPTFCSSVLQLHSTLIDGLSKTELVKTFNDSTTVKVFEEEQGNLRSEVGRRLESAIDTCEKIIDDVCSSTEERLKSLTQIDDTKKTDTFSRFVLGKQNKRKGMVTVRLELEEKHRAARHSAKEVGMLGEFIRLADYIAVEYISESIKAGSGSFLQELCARKPMKEMFIQTVVLSDSQMEDEPMLLYDPTDHQVQQLLRTTWELVCKVANSVPRILHVARLRPYLAAVGLDNAHSLGVENIVTSSEGWIDARIRIRNKCNGDFIALQRECAPALHDFVPLFLSGKHWDAKEFKSKGWSVRTLGAEMEEKDSWLQRLEEVKTLYQGGHTYYCKTDKFKEGLTPIAQERLDIMKSMMKELYSSSSLNLKAKYEEQDRIVERRPADLEGFATYVDCLVKVRVARDMLHDEFKQVERMSYLLDYYGVDMLPTEKLLLTNLKKAKKKFERAMITADGYEAAKKEGRKLEVKNNIKRINKQLKKMREQLCSGPFVDSKQDPSDVVQELEKVKESIDVLVKASEAANRHLQSFKVPQHKFGEIEKVTELYLQKHRIWENFNRFVLRERIWNTEPFSLLNMAEIDKEVKDVFIFATKINKQEKNSLVTKRFKNHVQSWKIEMPLLVELGSPAMKPKHWAQLWDKFDLSPVSLKELTVNRIRGELKMFDRKNLVADISGAAQGEYVLVEKLRKISTEWNDMKFSQIQYRDSTRDFVLSDIESIITLIEDHQINLQAMLSSPFVGPVQFEVEKWSTDLSFLSDVLDEWVLCQRNWMYLEPIFSASDIRKAMQKEASTFKEVDRFFRKLQREVHKTPQVLAKIQNKGLLDRLISANKKLDRIQKELEDYLETKRAAFARFYFLSNDELIVILSQMREPQAVQPHLLKCFDNIARLRFTEEIDSNEVTHMRSQKGELVKLVRSVHTKGNPETWLGEVESMMKLTVRNNIKQALIDYPIGNPNRDQWYEKWPAQAIMNADLIMWTFSCMKALMDISSGSDQRALDKYYSFCEKQIQAMVSRVRGRLSNLQRKLMSQMLILDVHARDVVQDMIREKAQGIGEFIWAKQMRYYWETCEEPKEIKEYEEDDGIVEGKLAAKPQPDRQSSVPSMIESSSKPKCQGVASLLDIKRITKGGIQRGEHCVIRQTNAIFKCSYEYQGCAGRLVITPLTDKCYLTLTGALHLHRGGAPQGPAGTGKTETVKDLAKSLSVKTVVFNCSDGLTAAFMARFFSGLSQCGAFCCFDEFNRIDIEVLSVIAEQILTIQHAIIQQKSTVDFNGRIIGVNPMFGVFITMNPGYAGRTELPDNLKALFRPVAMMIPDYALIAQIILFSEGFQNATILAQKMVQLYRLSSEQLSKQDHYDFGMRAVMSVLTMAGNLKRANPKTSESDLLIRAMRESNVAKFLDHDLPLFKGIISDLFPGVDPPGVDYGMLETTIRSELKHMNLESDEKVKPFIDKILQLYETMLVRHGVMVVGSTMSGKSTLILALERALTSLSVLECKTVTNPAYRNPNYKLIKKVVLNPKAVDMKELYGFSHPITQEWTDGLIGKITREFSADCDDCKKWCMFDGPVDTIWIESMNTVLDDNKVLCLGNGEVIKIPSEMTMLFENDSLSEASPATVSRCGMVYIEPLHLGWKPLVRTWRAEMHEFAPSEAKKITELLLELVGRVVQFVRSENGGEYIKTVDKNLIKSCLNLLGSLLIPDNGIDKYTDPNDRHTLAQKYVFLSIVWSFGANLNDEAQRRFDRFARKEFKKLVPDLPLNGSVYDYWVNGEGKGKFEPWSGMVKEFHYNPRTPFFNILVPTEDTVKFNFLLDLLVSRGTHVKFVGDTGVGKTVLVQNYFMKDKIAEKFVFVPVTFSAQTSSRNLQDVLETKLVTKRKTVLGAPFGKKVMVFIDDVNMPAKEKYGAQPPIELLRQCLDQQGFYDRKRLFFKNMMDVQYVAACAPPGGGRSEITARATRHFHLIWQPQLSQKSMRHIFRSILGGFFKLSAPHLSSLVGPMVSSSVELYAKCCSNLLPTPARSHYTFNLRDLSKVVQGIMMVKKTHLVKKSSLLRLWLHESARVFRDRLVDEIDRKWFDAQCVMSLQVDFREEWTPETFNRSLFGDYETNDKSYGPIESPESLPKTFDDQLAEYNSTSTNQMQLVFFEDAIMHISRIARVLRQPRGHALLIGMGGSGRRTLTRFAAFINDYQSRSVELKGEYGLSEWREDIKSVMFVAGLENTPVVLEFADTQVVEESFLENINNILNSGEVPNLFESEDFDKILNSLKSRLVVDGIPVNRSNAFRLFVERVRRNLHIVLMFSPVGDGLRARCRQYPSLVNCCTIDWFDSWPDKALYTVAERLLLGDKELSLPQDSVGPVSRVCVIMHRSVKAATKNFYDEMHRRAYTTPSSYLTLINQYCKMLKEHKKTVVENLRRYQTGLKKLADTEILVGELRAKIVKMQPVLQQESEETAKLLVVLQGQKNEAKTQETNCTRDARACKRVQVEVAKQKDECKTELEKALPAYHKALAALDTINNKDIGVMRGFPNPPLGVKKVMEAVCILFRDLPDVKGKTDWAVAKKLLAKNNFVKMCKSYDKDNIPQKVLRRLKPYTEDKDLKAEVLENVSTAAVSLCLWAKAMYTYATVAKEIEPKRERLAAAEAELAEAKKKLDIKMNALREVQDKVRGLQRSYRKRIRQRDDLKRSIEKAEARLVRAGKLTGGLSTEAVRWEETAKTLTQDVKNLTGNVLLAAGFMSYLGPFTAPYRQKITTEWVQQCASRKIAVDTKFSVVKVLADPLVVRQWAIEGLPADNYSVENGLMAISGGRWPLMIDPQGQANRWIKNMGARAKLSVIKQTDSKYFTVLQNSITLGTPVLFENVGDEIDAALDPVLRQHTFKKQGQIMLRFMDQDVPYNKKFRLYMSTKLPNPHYMPEVFIKTTVINFTVTPKGLEDQLLVEVCKLERADLEEKNDELILQISGDRQKLVDIEKRILWMLSEAKGNILDNETLINTLAQSKDTSSAVKERVLEAEKVVATINITREKYRVVATRASILYFIIGDLSLVDPMYQYSLMYFIHLYRNRIARCPKPVDPDDLASRLRSLLDDITIYTYNNICRGLFEKDKPLLSFLIAVKIEKNKKKLTDEEFRFFIIPKESKSSNLPAPPWISEPKWRRILGLEYVIDKPGMFTSDNIKLGLREIMESDDPANAKLPATLGDEKVLSKFQALLLIKTLREDVLTQLCDRYVEQTIGKEFNESPSMNMKRVFEDSDHRTPITFVLSPGADPMSYIIRLAKEKSIDEEQFAYISLGQGQGSKAEALMRRAQETGGWVCLQNCHLSASWLPKLEQVLEDASRTTIHEGYRLWLTSMPTEDFPVSILQQSIKVTNEPPKGLRANMKRTFLDIEESQFEGCSKPKVFKKLLFGLAFFHAVCQERRKYGAIGWNIPYEWMNSDLEVSISQLRMHLDEQPQVPWETLQYIIGEVNYGGRITDDKDIRVASEILHIAISPEAISEGYAYSASGKYHAPTGQEKIANILQKIESLPGQDMPEVFGLHENANITYQLKESKALMDSILKMSPSAAGGSDSGEQGKATKHVLGIVKEFQQGLPQKLIHKDAHESTFEGIENGTNTLGILLSQEIVKFNSLLDIIQTSLKDLQDAIHGVQVMSSELETLFSCFIIDRVPEKWSLYPSLKPLGAWFVDLRERVRFMRRWLRHGAPMCFWISCFFFPQGFMTSLLQRYARRTKIPIDSLRFRTDALQNVNHQEVKEPPSQGAYIYGLSLQGAGWDMKKSELKESERNVLFVDMPPIWLDPVKKSEWNQSTCYECPIYKTTLRAGTLTTTGHSSNYVMSMYLNSQAKPDHWVRRGVALVCMSDT